MSNNIKEIRNALNSLDMEHARKLLAHALKDQPNADLYYLASLAAIDEDQRIKFLNQALETDPTHTKAKEALTSVNSLDFRTIQGTIFLLIAAVAAAIAYWYW